MICNYCGNPRDNLDGYHSCRPAQDAKARIEASIEAMTRVADHDTLRTSEKWDVNRKKRMGDIAGNVHVMGGETRYGGDDGGND